jgi:hypothetical protein
MIKAETAAPKLNLKDYEGSYELNQQLTLNVSVEGDKLIGQATGQGSFELVNVKGDEFELTVAPVKLKFVRDENKKVVAVEVDQNGNIMKANKNK